MGFAKRFAGWVTAVLIGVALSRAAMAHANVRGAGDGDVLASIAAPHAPAIPEDALRLRIIANSDSPRDQALKLAVRNAVIEQVGRWLQGAHSEAQARAIVEAHVPQIRATALAVEAAWHVDQSVQVEVARVPFPTKVYGNLVYPAGEYEALRIVLGRGQGANWWCVLYPPLCFIDITEGDAVPNTGGFPDLPPLETLSIPTGDGHTQKVQVRLWTLDHAEEWIRAIAARFH
ncbi:stage II sporulation protein R [Alicyclobacillus acidocaldarius]|uniref:stage II sporulation protein R n=1 Tax=Alicyclobacillus acidocaldarius TaxID=405212 RepID=UPI00345F02C5